MLSRVTETVRHADDRRDAGAAAGSSRNEGARGGFRKHLDLTKTIILWIDLSLLHSSPHAYQNLKTMYDDLTVDDRRFVRCAARQPDCARGVVDSCCAAARASTSGCDDDLGVPAKFDGAHNPMVPRGCSTTATTTARSAGAGGRRRHTPRTGAAGGAAAAAVAAAASGAATRAAARRRRPHHKRHWAAGQGGGAARRAARGARLIVPQGERVVLFLKALSALRGRPPSRLTPPTRR